jgi:hypothetical protein
MSQEDKNTLGQLENKTITTRGTHHMYSSEVKAWKRPEPVTEHGKDATDPATYISEILDKFQRFYTREGKEMSRADLRYSRVPEDLAPNTLLVGPEDVLERIRINPIPQIVRMRQTVQMALLVPDSENTVLAFISFKVHPSSGQIENVRDKRLRNPWGVLSRPSRICDALIEDFTGDPILHPVTPSMSIVFVDCYAKTGVAGDWDVYGINYPLK